MITTIITTLAPTLITALAVSPLAPQDLGIQTVVATIAEVALENAALPEETRVGGDALADLYIRRACDTGQPASAIVLGISYALEPTGVIAANPLTARRFTDVESAELRKERLAAMGQPTLRGREDWLAHFVVSAGLAVAIGDVASEVIGIQKEVSDAVGKENGTGSGFSFTDLNADLAGIAFAGWLTGAQSKEAIAEAGKSFEGIRFLPDPADLPDGLTMKDLQSTWGGIEDPRFAVEVERLRRRASQCTGYGAMKSETPEQATPPDPPRQPNGEAGKP